MLPAVIIRKEGREEMLIRRHIEISSGSRCCSKHTVCCRIYFCHWSRTDEIIDFSLHNVF